MLGHHNAITEREQATLKAKLNKVEYVDSTDILSTVKYVSYKDKSYYDKKYLSFTDSTGKGNFDELQSEIRKSLKNLATNSLFFGLGVTMGYDRINLDVLENVKKIISSTTSKYDTEKKELVDHIENLLKIVSECIIIDINKYGGQALGYPAASITGITSMTDSNQIFGKSYFRDFLKNLQGKNYNVYSGFWSYNDRKTILPVTDFDLSAIADFNKEFTDVDTDIKGVGLLTLDNLNTRISDVISFIDSNAKYLFIKDSDIPTATELKNKDLLNVENTLKNCKLLYQKINYGGKTLYVHIEELIKYYQLLLSLVYSCLVVDFAGNAAGAGPITGFNDETILAKYDGYGFVNCRDFFDTDKISTIMTTYGFATKVNTIKSLSDDRKKYRLPFSKFAPLYDDYAPKIPDYTDLTSAKSLNELYNEIDLTLDHINTHKIRLGLDPVKITSKIDINLDNLKITKPANANKINFNDLTGKTLKLDDGIDKLTRYINDMILIASKIYVNFDKTLNKFDEKSLNNIKLYDSTLPTNVIGSNNIIAYLNDFSGEATVINSIKNKIEAFEEILPVSKFKTKYLEVATMNTILDDNFTTAKGKTGTDLYNLMDDVLNDVFENYEILDETNKTNKGTTINSKADITYQHILDIITDVSSKQPSDALIKVYVSGNKGAVKSETLDNVKRRLHEFITYLLKGIYEIRNWDVGNGNVLTSIDITGAADSNAWLTNIAGANKKLLTELANLNGDGRDLIGTKPGAFIAALVPLTGGSNKHKSIYLDKYLKYKNKYLALKQLMGY